MKRTTIIIIVLLVVASLSIGINIGLTWDRGIIPQPQVTSTPKPTSPPTEVAIAYSEQSRTTIGSNTKIVLLVNVTLTDGESASLDFSDFILRVYVPRGGVPSPAPLEMQYTSAQPKESGSITIESGVSKKVSFPLTFEFPTMGKNFDDNTVHFSSYQLEYKSVIPSIQWTDR